MYSVQCTRYSNHVTSALFFRNKLRVYIWRFHKHIWSSQTQNLNKFVAVIKYSK